MRTSLTLPIALAALATSAQCPFNPTITPNNLMLCPNTGDILTTQVYDAYQWYKEGTAIPGATGQTHPVDAYLDAGSMFSVEATDSGCTEMSPEVLVDGWAFLPPYVIHAGASALYTDGFGIPHHCEGDTVLLIFSITENVQWTNNGANIPGATDDTLVVVDDGNFSGSGAPTECPNAIMQLGVTITLAFDAPQQPTITQNGSQLCASPAGLAYQWYYNGQPLAANPMCIASSGPGTYVVDVTYNPDCSIPSDPFLITAVQDPARSTAWLVRPTPANEQVVITAGSGTHVEGWQLLDLTGRVVRSGNAHRASSVSVRTSDLPTGRYWFSPANAKPLPVTILH